MKPGLRLTSFIRWIYKSATSTYDSMRELLKTGIFLFLLKSNEAELCCFDVWTPWQPSSKTCGNFCKGRTRNIIDSTFAIFGDCHYDHYSCPSYELQSSSCDYIECRKLYLNIVQSYLIFLIPNFLNPLISKFTSDIDWLERLVNMSSHLRSRNSIKKKIMCFREQ